MKNFFQNFLLITLVFLSLLGTQDVIGQVVASWDFFGETSPATSTADVYSANLDATNILTRGAGAVASSASNSFRTTGFQNNGISTANTDYFEFAVSAASGYTLSLTTIDARLAGTPTFAATPGVSSQFAYSLDGTTFTLIGTPTVTVGTPTTISVSLTGVPALQNLPASTTVTFRYYASGQTTTGGWGFNSPVLGQNGLAISGAICPILTAPAPVAVVSSQSTCATSCTLSGGVIAAPTTSCPVGSTLQYSTDAGVSWSTTLPTYNQTTAVTVLTRCNCDADNTASSPTSTVTTVPGTCTPPTLSLTPSCGGGAGTGIITPTFTAGAGGTPTYNPTTLTGLANGDYTVTVTESGSGCTATSSATISCTTVTGSADGTDPCFCLTPPTLDADNNVTSDGTFGDEMVITTSGPSNPNLVWEVSASTATTPVVTANFINNNDGTYHIAITYPAGAGGSAGTWSITATETSGSGLPNITVSGGSLCAYTVGTLADITTPVCSTAPITLTATPTGGTFGGAGTGGTYTPAPTGSAQGPLAYNYTYDAHPAVGSNPACPLTLNADISVPACVAGCDAVAAAPTGTITPTTFCRTGGPLTGSNAGDATPLTDFNLYDRLYLLVDNATGIIVSNATITADLIAPDNTTTTPIVYSVYSLVYDIAQGVVITNGTSTITVGSNVIKDGDGDALQASPTVAACMDLSPAASTTVTVNPKPELGDDLDDATCSGASAAIDLYANVSGLPANPWTGLTVTWTAALTSGSATGFNNQTTPVTVDNTADTFEITDVLINTDTTTYTSAVVTYTITPTPNANGCSGDPYVVALTVYPALNITFAPVCSVDGTTYDLNFTILGGSGDGYAATYANAGTGITHVFGDATGTITGIPIATTSVTLEVVDGNIGGASSNNCSYTETYTFTPPALSLVPSCVSGTGTITPTFTAGAGGTPSYSPSTLSGLANGDYTVTVTESGSGCTATSSATISCSPLCPTLTAAAPAAVVTTESTCTSCSLSGGVIDAPATSCPVGSTLQYSTDGTTWSTTLPTYNQTTAITVLTRCNCDVDTNVSSPTSSVTTAPGTCTPVSAGLSNDGPICSGSTATFTATPAGAATYAWSAGGSTTDVTTTAALTADATYTVVVTAANGCASTATSTVTVNSTTAGLTNNGPVCSGSTATFTATPAGATTYVWSAGGSAIATTITPTLTANATYTVTVTANGCSSTASSTVTVNALPTLSLTPSCGGGVGTGIITPTFTAGAGGAPSYNPATLTGLADGDYTVIVTESGSGCTNTASTTITCTPVCPILTAAAPAAVVPTESTCALCSLSGGVIDAPATSCPVGSTLQYSTDGTTWSTTLPTYNQTTAITVLTRCNCNVDTNVSSPTSSVTTAPGTCTPVSAGLSNDGPICSGSTATFTATPAGATTYAWSAGGSTTDVTTTGTLSANATYTVVVTAANGCASTATSTVTVNATPSFTGTASCSGVAGTGSISQTATGGTAPYTYTITGGSFGATLADGNYTVIVTDNNNCSTTSTVLVNCSGALIALGNADATDPCYCVTPPTLDANNTVITNGTFGDEMVITTNPVNSALVWEVLTSTATTPIVGTNFTNNGNGTYTLNITYPAGAGGSAGSWSITATEKTGTNLPNITVSGGSSCSYVIGSLVDVVAPACSAATITLTGTPSGGTLGGVATAGTYSPTPSNTAQGPFQYTYTYNAHPAVGIHPACPLTLKADITIPACTPSCTPAAGTW